jgi:hypothetical protein
VGPPDDAQDADDAGRAWVAPESTPTGTAPPIPTPAAIPVVDDEGDEGPVRLPVPLRPMTMGDLLDGGFNVLRIDPRTVLGLAAVFIVPVQLLVAFLNRNALEDLERLFEEAVASTGTNPTATVGSTWGSIISAVGASLGQALVGAGLALLVVAWYAGGRPDLGDVLRGLRARWPAVVWAWLLIHLIELAGSISAGIGSVVAMVFFIATAPAIAVEGISGTAAMGRSARLAGKRFWFVLGFALLSGLVASTLGQVLGLLPQTLGLVLGPDLGWIALGVGNIITQLVTTTIVGAATVLLYLDLRIRQEGMDLAWAADRHLPAS